MAGMGETASDVETASFSERETPIPPVTKEDHIINLLEELVRGQQQLEGKQERVYIAKEGWLAVGAEESVSADFPHDAWVVYARHESESNTIDSEGAVTPAFVTLNSVLRVVQEGNANADHGIEIPRGVVLRLKSTSNHLSIYNLGPDTAYVWAIAVSLAEVKFDLIAHYDYSEDNPQE